MNGGHLIGKVPHVLGWLVGGTLHFFLRRTTWVFGRQHNWLVMRFQIKDRDGWASISLC